jgi:hypothetical protein
MFLYVMDERRCMKPTIVLFVMATFVSCATQTTAPVKTSGNLQIGIGLAEPVLVTPGAYTRVQYAVDIANKTDAPVTVSRLELSAYEAPLNIQGFNIKLEPAEQRRLVMRVIQPLGLVPPRAANGAFPDGSLVSDRGRMQLDNNAKDKKHTVDVAVFYQQGARSAVERAMQAVVY